MRRPAWNDASLPLSESPSGVHADAGNSNSSCSALDLTCVPVTLFFLLNSQRGLWDAAVIIVRCVDTHTHTHKQRLHISLGTGHCRHCLIALRGKREAGMKTGADLPPLLLSSSPFSALFAFLFHPPPPTLFLLLPSVFHFFPHCPSFSERRLHH